MKSICAVIICFAFSGILTGGTLILKDGSIISDLDIISIREGYIVVERDRAKRRIAFGKVREYFDSNIKAISDITDNTTASYKVTASIDMPEYGYKTVKSSKRKQRQTTSCEISYRINIDEQDPKLARSNRVKIPFFYLYVLTSGEESSGGRQVFCYSYPDTAKVRSKSYDRAEIISNLKSFNRPVISARPYHSGLGLQSNSSKNFNSFGDRKFTIPLKRIKYQRILAYYLEVWGKDDVVCRKEWVRNGYTVSKNWWELLN